MTLSKHGHFQKLGKALMLPVSLLPVAALLIGAGSINIDFLPDLMTSLMTRTGELVFLSLPLIFAVGTAIGLTHNDGTSALAAVAGYLFMVGTMSVMTTYLHVDAGVVLGFECIDTGLFGGIVVGILAALLFQNYHQKSLPSYLSFFSGKRLVLILTAFVAIPLGITLSYIWPFIQQQIILLSEWSIKESPAMTGFIYGVVERALVPLGLHHIWNIPFQDQMGVFIDMDGYRYTGDIARFLAGDPNAGFLAGGYLFKMFGLPAAALAIWQCSRPEARKQVAGIMFSAALISFLTGITEPIEFSFLFAAPLLYIVHSILAGLAYALTNLLNIKMAMSFSNGLIDFALYYGLGTKPFWLLILGTLYGACYYLVFRTLILKLNLKTPGRETSTSEQPFSITETAWELTEALGGSGNIAQLSISDNRLDITVLQPDIVEMSTIRKSGATTALIIGNHIQAVLGSEAEKIQREMKQLIQQQQRFT